MSPKKPLCEARECPVDVVQLSERIAANEANHDEILRRLAEISMGLRNLDTDIRNVMAAQSDMKIRITTNESDTKRVETRLNTIMGAIGALILAVVTGGFAVAGRFMGK